jgi:hypothetical protein
MKRLFIVPLLALCLFATGCMAGNLVLSRNLALDYPEPELISHTRTALILKYEDWVLSHEIVDPENFYPGVDLSGNTESFIRAFFMEDVRPSLAPELREMAVKQREAFEISDPDVYRDTLGEFDILGGYSEVHGLGHLYIFDQAAIHHIVIKGNEARYKEVANSIKER